MSALFPAAVFAILVAAPAAAQSSGTFAHISDIHFNPFDPALLAKSLAATDTEDWQAKFAAESDQSMSGYGEDTNHALLASSLAAITKRAAGADFAVVTGDLLVHRFQDQTENALGFAENSAAASAFAVRTTIFVAEQLRAAVPDKPIFLSLGNNDSSCGDYQIEPGGDYLAATRETVRNLVGADLVAADFDETWAAGGYYAARHPTVANTTIIVLDDVMWSSEYQNACGDTGLAGADAMMGWLTRTLVAAKTSGTKIWLMHHIPVGIDAYSTAHSKESACPAKVVTFLKEPYASAYLKLLAEYGDIIQATFTGHTHFDDYRLVRNSAGAVIGVEKIAPAISPIFGQNPGFLLYSYDRTTGAPANFTAHYLANLERAADPAAADWQREYAFAETYGVPAWSPAGAEAMWKQLSAEGDADDTFRRLYNVSKGELGADTLPAYICAIGHADVPAFIACYCQG